MGLPCISKPCTCSTEWNCIWNNKYVTDSKKLHTFNDTILRLLHSEIFLKMKTKPLSVLKKSFPVLLSHLIRYHIDISKKSPFFSLITKAIQEPSSLLIQGYFYCVFSLLPRGTYISTCLMPKGEKNLLAFSLLSCFWKKHKMVTWKGPWLCHFTCRPWTNDFTLSFLFFVKW